MLHTTLKLCKEHDACATGFEKLKSSLNKDHSDTDLIPLTHVLESNGLCDAVWALRATVEDSDYVSREFAIFRARQVLSFYEARYPDDARVRDCICAAERYNNKEITLDELEVFKNAADEAAEAAYWSADVSVATDTDDAAYWAAWAAAGAAAVTAIHRAAYSAASYVAERDKHILKLAELLNNHKEK